MLSGSPAVGAATEVKTAEHAAVNRLAAPTVSREALLRYLRSLQTSSRTVVGQMTDIYIARAPMGSIRRIPEVTGGRQVACIGVTGAGQANSRIAQTAWNHIVDGALYGSKPSIVLYSFWPANPMTGSWTTTPLRPVDFRSLFTPGNRHYEAWHRYLRAVAHTLRQYRGALIFRPGLEMNGDWFWWDRQSPDDFIRWWIDLHDYLTSEGAAELLWAWTPNWGGGGRGSPIPYTRWYPGPSYVDLVGFDLYSRTNAPGTDVASDGGYAMLLSLNKPFILGETGVFYEPPGKKGPHPPPYRSGDNYDIWRNIRSASPQTVLVQFFFRQDERGSWAIADQRGARELMNDPSVVSHSELSLP